jgi:thioesterase-3
LIRESHLDTFGHVNNARYLDLFEEARWDIIEARGFGMKQIRDRKLGPVILDVSLKFAKELRLREQIVIRSESEPYDGGKVMTMVQTMLNQKGEICCVGRFTFGLFDLEKRKLVTPTEEWCYAVGLRD